MKYTLYKLIFWLTLLAVITLHSQKLSIPLLALRFIVTEAVAANIAVECEDCVIQLEMATPTTIATDKAFTLKLSARENTPNSDDEEADDKADSDDDQLDPQAQARQKDISRLKQETELLDAQVAKLTAKNGQMEQLLRREELKTELKQLVKPKYLSEPLVDGKLFISDRRIELNGEIDANTADLVTKSIHFYNNENPTYPIFLVITESPGGEFPAGAHIIEVMQHSQAPVYVVVKRVAASMAAIIVAQAPRSFAYPNAFIIHHPSRIPIPEMWLAQNQLQENSQSLKEWSQRLLAPVAKKMGITVEEFIKQMYEHNSAGEWAEFATEAQRLKWVDLVVSDIRETSFTTNPAADSENPEVESDTNIKEE